MSNDVTMHDPSDAPAAAGMRLAMVADPEFRNLTLDHLTVLARIQHRGLARPIIIMDIMDGAAERLMALQCGLEMPEISMRASRIRLARGWNDLVADYGGLIADSLAKAIAARLGASLRLFFLDRADPSATVGVDGGGAWVVLDPAQCAWRVVKSSRHVADGERILGIRIGDMEPHALEAEVLRVMALLSQCAAVD